MEATSQETCLIFCGSTAESVDVGSVSLRVCMYCGDLLGEKSYCGGPVTHSACEECVRVALAGLKGVRIVE